MSHINRPTRSVSFFKGNLHLLVYEELTKRQSNAVSENIQKQQKNSSKHFPGRQGSPSRQHLRGRNTTKLNTVKTPCER